MAENHVHGELTTTQCYNACRQLLKDRNGYECGTEEGTFLAAFASGTDALQFCVVVSAAWLCGAASCQLLHDLMLYVVCFAVSVVTASARNRPVTTACDLCCC